MASPRRPLQLDLHEAFVDDRPQPERASDPNNRSAIVPVRSRRAGAKNDETEAAAARRELEVDRLIDALSPASSAKPNADDDTDKNGEVPTVPPPPSEHYPPRESVPPNLSGVRARPATVAATVDEVTADLRKDWRSE